MKKPNLKEYRKLAREYAEKRGRSIPFSVLGTRFTLRDLVRAFKRNPHWIEFKDKEWRILDKYFPEFKKQNDKKL